MPFVGVPLPDDSEREKKVNVKKLMCGESSVPLASGAPSPEEGLGPVVLQAGNGGNGSQGGGVTVKPAPSDEAEHNYWGMH